MKNQEERRRRLGSYFITLLIGLSYPQLIGAVQNSLVNTGLSWTTLILPLTYFFISVRFYVGNHVILESDDIVVSEGFNWLYDLMIIMAQSIMLIFLASTSSVEASRKTDIDFFEILIALYVVDISWILSQTLIGRIFPKLRRSSVPYGWALLNAAMVISMVVAKLIIVDIYSTPGLIALFVLNLAAFVVDMVLLDYANVYKFRSDGGGA